jgi:carbon-monoxide dehydrogenase medium subunit
LRIRDHLFPKTVEEALDILTQKQDRAILISGGTDLIVAMRESKLDCEILVDICKIPGLGGIERNKNTLCLGPGVNMSQGESNPLVRQYGTALAEGCSWVGGPQIRNRATIVGNVVSAQPAADTAVPLFTLDAHLTIRTTTGQHTIGIEEAYTENGTSAIDPRREMVTSVFFECQKQHEVSVFKRMMKRKALALPVLNCAVFLGVRDEVVTSVRIALGPVAPRPLRIREAEACLLDKEISGKRIDEAASTAQELAHPRSSPFRGSSDYRREMVQFMVKEALHTALQRLEMKVPT